MKSLMNNIVFKIHPPLEFIYALNFAANKETMYKFYSDFNFIPAEEFKNTVEEMIGKLSRYTQNELKFFFQWEPMKDVLGKIAEENENIESTTAFIELISQMDEKRLLACIVGQALYGENSDASLSWSKDEDMQNAISAVVSGADNDSTLDKEKLMECVEDPLEVKARLVLLMKQFYAKCYKQKEALILSQLHDANGRYEKLFSNNPAFFADEYLCALPKLDYEKLIIHISYFTQIRVWSFDIKPYKNTKWITIGMYSEYYPRKKFIKARVQNFIKILSDKKRFEMIELLSKKPYYVHELSSELELTSPTVCYHLSYMRDLNVVALKRENSKTYYTLNKEVVRDLLNNAETILLNNVD